MSFTTYPDPAEILQVPGFLYWGPTTLATESGWGTLLGFADKGIFFAPNYKMEVLSGVERGNAGIMIIFCGVQPVVIAQLLNYKSVALSRIFPGLVDETKIRFPGDILPGTDLNSDTYTDRLLFVPQDNVNNPICLLQKAVPAIPETTKLLLSRKDYTRFPCQFWGMEKTTDADGVAYIGPKSGATLR